MTIRTRFADTSAWGTNRKPRQSRKGQDLIEIEAAKLAGLYERLTGGEPWTRVALSANCSAFGLKQCLIRAGFDIDIRKIRQYQHGKTRNIKPKSRGISSQFLSLPIRVSL